MRSIRKRLARLATGATVAAAIALSGGSAMAQDKKVRDGRLTLVLARGVGEAFLTRDVEPATVEAFLEGFLHDVPDAA